MKYIVRMNLKAWNPLTSKVDMRRVWEVEQCQSKDSEKCIWHCSEVRIRTRDGVETSIGDLFAKEMKAPLPQGEKRKPVEIVSHGIVVREADDAIVIREGGHDVA